ncbi:hypothetical protein [Nocardia sp. BMG51109]|nr:hypothetical protein [Nocardia sp. BMG51109]
MPVGNPRPPVSADNTFVLGYDHLFERARPVLPAAAGAPRDRVAPPAP